MHFGVQSEGGHHTSTNSSRTRQAAGEQAHECRFTEAEHTTVPDRMSQVVQIPSCTAGGVHIRLMADVDTALEQQIFDLSQRQRVADIYHHREADDLGRTVEVAERIVHRRELRDLTFQLNPIYSDIASAPNNSVFVDHYNNHCYHESIGNVTPQMPTSGDTPQSLKGDKNQNTNHPKPPLR